MYSQSQRNETIRGQSTVDAFASMLTTPGELWQITLQDPTRGIRLFNIHYLRNDISAEMITWYYSGDLRPPRPRSDLPEDEEAMQRLRDLGQQLSDNFDEEYPDYQGENWSSRPCTARWYP